MEEKLSDHADTCPAVKVAEVEACEKCRGNFDLDPIGNFFTAVDPF